jgi:Ca2+-binding EF-hand superfamily protein
VTLKELKSVMKSLGLSPTNDELKEMISSVDHNGDNEIDFDEFLILMRSRGGKKTRNPEQELIDAFKVFDTDNSGSIDKHELKSLMDSLGQKLSSEELDAMMDEVDTDGNGEISYEEFKAMMVGD